MHSEGRYDAFSGTHPIINIFYFMVVLGFTMFLQHPVFLIVSFLGATSYGIWLLGWKRVFKMNFLLTLPALVIVALVNPLFNHYGVTTIAYLETSGNAITLEAMVYGVVLGSCLFIVIEWFSCYNQVMTSDKFIYLFGRVIPAMSLILSMVLRFVPRFANQLNIIRNGQKCTGHDVSNGKLLDKIKNALAMLSILVTWALENAIETADSMKSRGYGLKGRSAYSVFRFDTRDLRLGLCMLGCFLVTAVGCAKGAGFAQYNPRILLAGFVVQGHEAPVDCPVPLAMAAYACFAMFCFMPLLMGLKEDLVMRKALGTVGKDMETTYRMIYEELDQEGQKA